MFDCEEYNLGSVYFHESTLRWNGKRQVSFFSLPVADCVPLLLICLNKSSRDVKSGECRGCASEPFHSIQVFGRSYQIRPTIYIICPN